jgi:PAS domain S-box-containing protein
MNHLNGSGENGKHTSFEVLWQNDDYNYCKMSRNGDAGLRHEFMAVSTRSELPNSRTVDRLLNEYALREHLDDAWAMRPLEVGREQGKIILVLEQPRGQPLAQLFGYPMDIDSFLRLAVAATQAVGRMHEGGIVHKDIKPNNLIVDSVTWQVQLTGFGIASRLPRQHQSPTPPEFIEGTLPYMAPEQTGRMNRSIDSRSDLYSLGVTLYEVLTGSLPYAASDPMEWVHCHIARLPLPPAERRPEVPEAVSAIIMKLLTKTPEERYQTAAGIESDLRKCLGDWETHGRIDSFLIGAKDIPDRLLIPEKLYGREREVQTLLDAFDRIVVGGRPELVLVSGYSGIGKSAMVNELHKPLVRPRGLFASGKFDQYKRDIPYSTLAQAFQSLIRPLLSMPEAELSKWRDDLLSALNPNGSLLVDLVPKLKLIIGEQPTVSVLPSRDAKTRAHLAFRRFIGVFARTEHPLALFLDDLQWLDAATLDFLEDLLVQQDLSRLLVVGAYRDNEVAPAHPLMRKLSAIREAGGTVQEILLAPLSSGDLARLVADTLHCASHRSTSLAQLIHDKTAGNPFFAIQFISALDEEGLITFEHENARWRWDLDAIYSKGYTDNVVDLMVNKLNRLPVTTQRALEQFACIGNSAEATTLSAVLETSEQETEAALWEALHQELIVRSEDSYRFVHDRIQETAYSLIAEEARAEAHLRIGRLLNAHTPPKKREEAIFEIVSQFNRGAGLITSEDERFQLAELNLIAGKRAKASTAYASALQYSIAGAALLTNECWERRHDLIFQLELHRAECEFLTGELTIAAERLEILRSRAADTIELAAATCLGIDVYMTLGQIDRAVTIGLDYLHHLKIEWPVHPTEEQARTEYERIRSLLGSYEIEEVIDFPLMNDPTSIATLDVLTKMSSTALFADKNLYALVICRAVSLSIEHGNNDGSCVNYAWLSLIGVFRFSDYKNALRFAQLGYELVEKRGLKRFQAATYVVFAVIVLWKKNLSACANVMRDAFEIANKVGDLTYSVYSCIGLTGLLIATGDPLDEVQREAENSLSIEQKAKFSMATEMTATHLGLIRTLRGLTAKFGSFDDGQFNELRFERQLNSLPAIVHCWYWTRKLQAHFFAGDFVSAIVASSKARPTLLDSPSFEVAEYEFYSALARAAFCDSATAGQSREHFDALAAHHKQLEIWAELCPENFENRAALVGAELARAEGREADAMRLYEQAIHSSRENGFVQNEGVAHEVAARFYAARGLETSAEAHLRNARHCYLRWGADGKVRQLDELYPGLREDRSPAASATIGPPVGQFDVETVVKASQAISSEMLLPDLIEKLLRVAVENAGAERGLLILLQGGEPWIEAEATTGKGGVEVVVRQAQINPSDLPQSALHYVIRAQESVLLDDALADDVYAKDEYVRQKRSRSVLCLPIVKQAKLVGVLYLENNLTPCVFTPDRFTVLQLLASQAAISLENAALYSDLQLQAGLLQRLPVSAWTLNPDGMPDFVNQIWLEYSGQTLDFVRSDPEAWMTAVHPEDREAASRSFWGGVHSGQGFAMEARSLRAQDDTYRWQLHQAVALRDSEGKVLKFVGTTTDIDEQKRAEEAAHESEHEARLTVDSIPGLIAVLNVNGEIERISQPIVDYFGRPLDELRHWAVDDTMHPDDRPRYLQAFEPAFAAGHPFEHEVRIRRFDGVYRWFHMRGLPLRDMHGHIVRWYFLLTEVEDRKRAEDALRQAQGDLARINRVTTMGELAASLAHEVSQPTSGVLINANVCLRKLGHDNPDLDEVRAAVTRIQRDAQRAADVIGRIRSQFEKATPNLEVLDVNEIIRETADLLRSEALRYNISVRTELAVDLPQIIGGRVQLQQVTMNLLVNAIAAMKDVDGIKEMVIRTHRDENEQILATFSDTGIGLPPQLAEQIFDPFFTTKPHGTGMGLRISRSIIESHGGRLWATENDGPGASFCFTIPLHPEG